MPDLPFIDLTKATASECVEYAAKFIGTRIPGNVKDETARSRLADMIKDESGEEWTTLFAAFLPQGPPQGPPEPAAKPEAGAPDLPKPVIRRVRIKIMEEKGEKQPVFVGVNFKGYSIQRGKEVEVPAEVVSALRNAVKTVYDPETMEAQDVPIYPFQILN